MSEKPARGMTLIEFIIVVIVITIVLIVLLDFTPGHHHRQSALRVVDLSNLRQVSVALVAYANDNNDWMPGLDVSGVRWEPSVESRYRLICEPVYIHPEAFISRYDDQKAPWVSGEVTSDHYSYAMLQLPEAGGRLDQWTPSDASDVVWLSGRNTGKDAGQGVDSVQTNDLGEWRGPVGWADGHVTTEDDHYVDTQYGDDAPVNKDDNIFDPAGNDDAYMIYTGN